MEVAGHPLFLEGSTNYDCRDPDLGSKDPADVDTTVRVLTVMLADPPSPIDLPRGCGFAGRCPYAVDRCRQERPDLRLVPSGRRVACHLVDADERPPDQYLLTTQTG